MLVKIFENLRIINNGKVDLLRLFFIAIPVLAFFLWRTATLGITDSEQVLSIIKTEIANQYKEKLYKEYELLDKNTNPRDFPFLKLKDIEVELGNVSIAASLLSWSAKEDIDVKFDYILRANGEIIEENQNVYLFISRKAGAVIWPSGPIRHYLKYIF